MGPVERSQRAVCTKGKEDRGLPRMRLGSLADHTIGVSQVRKLMSGSSVYSGNSVSHSHCGVLGRYLARQVVSDAFWATYGTPNRFKCIWGRPGTPSRSRCILGDTWYVKSPSGAFWASSGAPSRRKSILGDSWHAKSLQGHLARYLARQVASNAFGAAPGASNRLQAHSGAPSRLQAYLGDIWYTKSPQEHSGQRLARQVAFRAFCAQPCTRTCLQARSGRHLARRVAFGRISRGS